MEKFCLLVILIVGLVNNASGHGHMKTPAARNVAYRYGFNTPANHNHNELNCGGLGVQHSTNGLVKISFFC